MEPIKCCVFCPPPLGKPDPKQPRPKEGPDTRTRVIQKGSTDDTCWYSAANLLRERYRAPNSEKLEERKFEKVVSTLRKSIAAHHRSVPDIAFQLNNGSIKEFLSGLTKDIFRDPQTISKLQALDDQCAPDVSLSSSVASFLKQETYANMYDYLVYKKNHCNRENYLQFFSQLGITPKERFEETRRCDPAAYRAFCENKEWEEIGLQKDTLLDHFARHEAAKIYNMKLSTWHPQQPIEKLLSELQTRGPLIVGGCFGTSHYAVPPRKLEIQIEGKPTYGWVKSDPKNPNRVQVHTIVIVGAQKTAKQELVFYIDPENDSDPAHPEKQKIFCMSYNRLTSPETICDYHGFLRNNAPLGIGYAVYKERTCDSQ